MVGRGLTKKSPELGDTTTVSEIPVKQLPRELPLNAQKSNSYANVFRPCMRPGRLSNIHAGFLATQYSRRGSLRHSVFIMGMFHLRILDALPRILA